MTKPLRVLLHNDETAGLARILATRFPETRIAECNSYAALPEAMAQHRPDVVYTVRFAGTPGFPHDALFGSNGPSWIANGGAGTDHFGHWDKRKVTVTNAAGVAAEMMAEYVMGGFLHFTLDVPGLEADKAARQWRARTVRPLKGKTLLIIGLGHTGRAIAARAKAFGMTVVGTRANPAKMKNVDEVHAAKTLPSLLPRADFIAISTPLTPGTRGCLGEKEVEVMKSGVILADVSRGGVVEQSALVAGLKNGKIGAAVLDVFEEEPLPADNALWGLPNVLISPHCSSVYDGWEMASFDLFLNNLDSWIAGRQLVNVVDPDRGY